MKCNRCGIHGITYGHQGFCGVCYMKERAHQRELQDASYEARKALEERNASIRRHPVNYAKRKIRLVACRCYGWSPYPCPMHREESA